MKVLFVNSVCGIGSTGKICASLAKEWEDQGHKVKIACGCRYRIPEELKQYAVLIGNKLDMYLHLVKSRLFDRHCFASRRATLKFVKWAETFDPDILWLHNLHGYYLNIEILFDWIKSRPDMQVKWTLHDCWAFTGHCTYFDMANCSKWENECNNCPQQKKYPKSYLFENTDSNFRRKQDAFCGVKNMTLITPSQWLADLTRRSFLKEYPVQAICNTINTEIFRPRNSDFRQRYNIENKKIVLGVAQSWGKAKGVDALLRAATILGNDYTVILVGKMAKKLKEAIHIPNVIIIDRTENQQQLAEIYSAADVFFNPTLQDNYPTVNLEAEACNTPVVTYDSGGAKETISRQDSVAVTKGDLRAAIVQIQNLCKGK